MKKTITYFLFLTIAFSIMAQQPNQRHITQTAGRDALAAFAPEFARANDDILFGEVWNRQDELPLHDRSIITVLSLMASGITDSSLTYHLQNAKSNGVTRERMAEAITHAAFYVGWPKAWAVLRMAKDVWPTDLQTRDEFQMSTPYPVGEPNTGYAKYFTGNSFLAPMGAEHGAPVNVTFEPGCRNNWHIHHHANQVLLCVAGRGWYQEEGKAPVELKPGVAVMVPQGVRHWHGAAKDSWMQHVAYHTNAQPDAYDEWLGPVTDDIYDELYKSSR